MVGGCCVCSDERGWTENPLVYCDGTYCNVAVHQACYGIVSVPTGPWFCRKCESQERQARVRCELCPSKDGALKRTDTGGWAHVVCSLYIPEVRFGNVSTMEPIILQLVPPDRFHKPCYICEEAGKESKASIGACMQCNKSGCKQYFHVTCAQAAGLLCEEAGNFGDNVKYCGYCIYHYQKLKKDNSNIKPIPAFKPIPPENATPESSPEKLRSPAAAINHQSMSLATEVIKPPKKKMMKQQAASLTINNPSVANEILKPSMSVVTSGSSSVVLNTSSFLRSTLKPEVMSGVNDNAVINAFPKLDQNVDLGIKNERLSEKKAKRRSSNAGSSSQSPKPATPSPTPAVTVPSSLPVSVLTSTVGSSPNPTPSFTAMYGNLIANSSLSGIKSEKVHTEKPSELFSDETGSVKRTKSSANDKKKIKKAVGNLLSNSKSTKSVKETSSERKPRRKKETSPKESSPVTNGNLPMDSNPQSLEQFLERQWTQGAQFLMEQAQHFDVASLLSCLHQLRAENERLEERVRQLISRREHLLAVNARLSHPLNGALNNHTSVISQAPPAMPTFMPNNNPGVIASVNSSISSNLPTTSTSVASPFENKPAANSQRLSQYQDMAIPSQMYQNISPTFTSSMTSPSVYSSTASTGSPHNVSNFITHQSPASTQQQQSWFRNADKR
ncbi:protein AF-10-like protein [Leptotrombidium deliense]|uniref:Protein AF-10-like protein n=1 Tax=Leptotrombidium deliense TaxID=299467 RepID=A0A443SH52_9ACAR|nr:protein AF-10-like protein [Leptotrombidium deliense]